MDALDAVERLARRARAESPPTTRLDVARVLRSRRPEPVSLRPLAWSAGASALAASLVLAAALRSPAAAAADGDSVSFLFAPLQVELP